MNLDDKALFLDAMEDVQPLKRHTDVHWQPTRNLKTPQRIDTLQLDNFLTTGFLDILPLNEPLEFRREGLQQGVIDKLRSGKYPQQASLNLLRQPVETCRKMLFRFILEAQKEGLRNVLIVRRCRTMAAAGHVMSRYVKQCRLNRITGSAMRSVVGKSLPLADRTASASSREPDFMPDITPHPNAQDSARERAITLSAVITRRNSHSLI